LEDADDTILTEPSTELSAFTAEFKIKFRDFSDSYFSN